MPKNYTKFSGDHVVLNLVFKDRKGNIIDTAGYIVFFVLRRKKDDADAIIMKTYADVQGQMQVVLAPEETKKLNGEYYYDISYKTPSGMFNVVDNGMFLFKGE